MSAQSGSATGMMEGRSVLVTGAAKGIGRAIANEMVRQGAGFVMLADVDGRTLAEAAAEAATLGEAEIATTVVDLADPRQVEHMVETAVAAGRGLDTLVNNAGVIESARTEQTAFEDVPLEVWDWVYAVNVRAMWLAMRFAAPVLRASERGPSVVNAASVSGMTGYGQVAYSSSKGAVIQLTRSAAIALSPHVRVNAFAPGTIDTEGSRSHRERVGGLDNPDLESAMTAAHLIPRMGRAEEVAQVACFLASDAASFLTGVILPVDAGLTAWRGHRR